MQRVTFWFVSSLPLLLLGYLLNVLGNSSFLMDLLLFTSTSIFYISHLYIFLKLSGIPYSKPLYTLSYMFITAGASGVLMTAIYFIVRLFGEIVIHCIIDCNFRLHIVLTKKLQVDVRCIRKPTVLFQWMGMNALIVYALAACDIFPAALDGFYWRSPENNLVII